jgi:hypothetical protein
MEMLDSSNGNPLRTGEYTANALCDNGGLLNVKATEENHVGNLTVLVNDTFWY